MLASRFPAGRPFLKASFDKAFLYHQLDREQAEQTLRATTYWHYPFSLPWGDVVPSRATYERHHLRRSHIFGPLLNYYGGSLAGKTVLDVGCCQGFWSFEASGAGARECLGIDSSPAFIREAQALSVIKNVQNCVFRQLHVEEPLAWEQLSPRHVTFFLGLFYHLADPVFALRKAMLNTLETLIIDTEIIRSSSPTLTIKSRNPDEPTTRNSNISTTIRLVPTIAALGELLQSGGFSRVEVIKPSRDMPREYHRKQRASLIAFR